MALIAPLIAFVGRFVVKIVNVAFGWATTLLFGQVPQSKQIILAGISLASIAWIATLVGVLVPDVGTFLVAAIPAPDFIQEGWIRLAMLIAAILLPVLIGVGGLFVVEAEDRPKGAAMVVQILRGYPYAAVLALTLLLLLVVAPVRKIRSIFKRWEDTHIPMVVKPGGYERVADDLEGAVDGAGLNIERVGAPWILETPSKLLAAVGGSGVKRLVPDRLLVFRHPALEVMIHPSDIAISGKKGEVARARAAIASRMTFTAAYLTTTKESQDVEERLERVSNAVKELAGATDRDRSRAEARRAAFAELEAELHAVDDVLKDLEISQDDWEVLYRERLQVERDLVRAQIEPRDDSGRERPPLERVADAVKSLIP